MKEEEKLVVLTLRISAEEMQRLEDMSKELGMTRSSAARLAVVGWLDGAECARGALDKELERISEEMGLLTKNTLKQITGVIAGMKGREVHADAIRPL